MEGKSILVTNGDNEFNQMMTTYLLGKGHRVTLQVQDEVAAMFYRSTLAEWDSSRLEIALENQVTVDSACRLAEDTHRQMGKIDLLIHGNEMVDESRLFEWDPERTSGFVAEQFHRIYCFTRATVPLMMRPRSGGIIFPLLYDALYYAGYPSSPILDHGKISMMKCLSRELAAFRIAVNAITFGYYDDNFDAVTRKTKKEMLEIFGLRPILRNLKEMIPAIDILVDPPVGGISGQNISIVPGIETVL